MLRCKSCKKLIGIEVEIEKISLGYSQDKREVVVGAYTTPSGRKKLEVEEAVPEWIEPVVIYECDFCGEVYEEIEVIQIMEELERLDNEGK
jgi:hypothetical protein